MRTLGRWLVRALARRVVYVLAAAVLAIVAQVCGIGEAQAQQSYLGCNTNGALGSANLCPDQGIAAAMAYAHAQYHIARGACGLSAGRVALGPMTLDTVNREVRYAIIGLNNNAQCATAVRAWPANQSCADRNANRLADAALQYSEASVSTCISGCKVQGTSYSEDHGGVKNYGMKDRTYTGDVCTPAVPPTNDISPLEGEKEEATKPKSPECTALGGGQTACVKPNGETCATASTGKTFCWALGETGKKTDGTEAQVKSPKGDPVTPPSTTISDQEWQRKEGHQQTACVNSTCTTYNVTNYSSVPAGTAKNSTGDNKADGSGNTSGNGASDEGKKGDDSKDSASDSGNCDTPPVCVGDTLKCLQLKFTWKIQCNTQGNEISAGNGCGDADVPVCAGKSCKAEAYAQVVQQWKQRCAMEKLAQGNAERAAGINNSDDAGVVEGIWGGEPAGSGMTLRQDLVNVGGGAGKLLPDVEIEGQHWTVPQGFYDAIAAVKLVIIAMCTVIAMFVVGRNI